MIFEKNFPSLRKLRTMLVVRFCHLMFPIVSNYSISVPLLCSLVARVSIPESAW